MCRSVRVWSEQQGERAAYKRLNGLHRVTIAGAGVFRLACSSPHSSH